jgi:hypothetical protein
VSGSMALRTEAVRNFGVIASPSLTEDSVDEATLDFMTEAAAPLIARSDILLSRVHFSPGEIDGQDGDNYRRALRAFQQANTLPDTSKLDAATWSALTHDQTEPVLTRYTITAKDVAGPFERRLSVNLVDMARLSGLSYSSPPAELAEMFHMGEDMGGVVVSYETIRRWAIKFGSDYARRLKRKAPAHHDVWHLDEVVISINGEKRYLWRAFDQEGYVLDEIVQIHRDTKAARRLLMRLLRKQGRPPKRIITDKLGSYAAAKREVIPNLEHRSHKGSHGEVRVKRCDLVAYGQIPFLVVGIQGLSLLS